jgi:ketosteroid isomerase-like protein
VPAAYIAPMTPEPSDIEVVEAVYAAMAAGDIVQLLALVDEACVITQDDRLPWGGRHVGHHGLATFGARLRESIQSQVTTTAVFTADGEVIQVGRTAGVTVATGRRVRPPGGSSLDHPRRPGHRRPLRHRHADDARRPRRDLTDRKGETL